MQINNYWTNLQVVMSMYLIYWLIIYHMVKMVGRIIN